MFRSMSLMIDIFRKEKGKKGGDKMQECCKDCPRYQKTVTDDKEESITDRMQKAIEKSHWYGVIRYEYGYELYFINEIYLLSGKKIIDIRFKKPDTKEKYEISSSVYMDTNGKVTDILVYFYRDDDPYVSMDLNLLGNVYFLLHSLMSMEENK